MPVLAFPDGDYIQHSKFYGYCSNTCPVNYKESCKSSKARFYKEFKNEPDLQSKKTSCQTTNTTTYYKGETGDTKEFTLVNPPGCSFPFNYKGKWYNNCISEDDPFCRKVV